MTDERGDERDDEWDDEQDDERDDERDEAHADAQRLAREWPPKAGQARHGAQGDGGEVGGVIMEDPLASAYRLRKGGERKQR